MNIKLLGKILGKIMILEGLLMIAPLAVSIIYEEGLINILAFAIPIALLIGIGGATQLLRPKMNSLYQKEGFALVAFVWVVMAVFGAIPFVINQDIPNYIDAIFEIMSGFTTTGASIITDLTVISHSTLFWRSFSHWIGGMGILAFVLIFIPESNDGSSMHLLRAESPGPQVGKIVSKMKLTTGILYLIYFGLTVLLFGLLMLDKPVAGYESDHVFFNILTSLGIAGTGGFGFIPGSLELFSPYYQYVCAIFLIIFGCNFGLYYLILVGKIRDVIRSEELHAYFIVVCTAVGLIFLSLVTGASQIPFDYTTEEAFRHSLFQVATLISTAGFSTTDFVLWPSLATTVLLTVMFTGAMAGSTAGGMKMSRIVIALKGAYVNVRKLINPRFVPKTKIEGKTLDEKTVSDVFAFITLYFFVLVAGLIVLSIDPINMQSVVITPDAGIEPYEVEHGFLSNFSAMVSCLSNIGPGFEAVGPYSSFAGYSWFSKLFLTFTMLLGRLEFFPVLLLFNPKTWKKV